MRSFSFSSLITLYDDPSIVLIICTCICFQCKKDCPQGSVALDPELEIARVGFPLSSFLFLYVVRRSFNCVYALISVFRVRRIVHKALSPWAPKRFQGEDSVFQPQRADSISSSVMLESRLISLPLTPANEVSAHEIRMRSIPCLLGRQREKML